MSSSINRFIRHADMFGQPIAMTFSRKEKVKTTFGGICSILFCLFVGWAIWNGSQNLIFKDNPKIIVTESFTENPRPMILTEENFPLAFAMQAPDELFNVEYLDSDIFKLEFVHQRFARTIKADGTKDVVFTETPIDMEKCTLSHFGPMASSFKYFNLNTMFCIAKTQTYIDRIHLEGNYDSPFNYEAIAVRVLECDDTVAGNTCKSASVRQSYLSGAYFNVIYTNMVVDSKNYEDPNSRFRDLYYTMINQKSYKRSYVQLTHVNVTTDSGWLVESSDTASYIKVSGSKEFTQNVDNARKILLSVTLQVSKLEEIYTRSYDKIQNIFADVGGIVSAAFIIVFLVLGPYTKLKLREALMNELFNIYKAPNSKKSKKQEDPKTIDIGSQVEQESIHLKTGKSEEPSPISNPKLSSIKTLRDDIPSTTSRYNNHANQRANPTGKTKPRPQYPPTTDSTGMNSSRHIMKPNGPADWRDAYNESPIFLFGKAADDPYRGAKKQEPAKKSTRPGQISPAYYGAALGGANTMDTPVSGRLEDGESSSSSNTKSPAIPIKEENVTIHISFCEFIMSKIYKTKSLKRKFELIDNGIKSINERLDVINVMKKLREVDKLKVLLLDDHQFALFNNLPKPEIRPKELRRLETERAFMLGLLASLKFIDGDEAEDIVHNAYQRISNKPEMTEIDRKLLEIFDNKRK